MTGRDSLFSFDVQDLNGKPTSKRKYKHPEIAGHHPVMDRILLPGESLTEVTCSPKSAHQQV